MDLDDVLINNSFTNQKFRNLLSVIALQLNNLSKFRIINNCAVTMKSSFECFQDFVKVDICGQALNSGQSFASVTLLDSYVDIVCCL